MPLDGNTITETELAALPQAARNGYAIALEWAERATNPWHGGVAHGIILGLEQSGLVTDASTIDRLQKGLLQTMSPAALKGIPENELADLGKGLKRPAAPSTQARR